MTIKEIEKQAGMERANIRFYEREGLISPGRQENGYRNYSDEELQILLRIKLLRSLHISLDEIRALKEGRRSLSDTLARQIAELEQEKEDVSYAQEVCRVMQEDRVTFRELDAERYLERIDRSAARTGSTYFTVQGDELPQVYHPWRRYLARTLDLCIYNVFWMFFLGMVFHVNLAGRNRFAYIGDTMIATVLMLFIEPLLLHLFGTTIGKVIFGLKLETSYNRRLSYGEAFGRTGGVVAAGMGLNIPVYNLVCLVRSYRRCSDKELLPWDDGYIVYSIRDTRWYRGIVYIGAYIIVFVFLFISMFGNRLPPNRGDLTIEEFADNFNYYARMFDIDFGGQHLDEYGKWVDKTNDGTAYIVIGPSQQSDFTYTIENGYVAGITLTVRIDGVEEWLGSYDTQMLLASLAYACAQKETGLFTKVPKRISEQIINNTFGDFCFTEAGLMFNCHIEQSGYMMTDSDILLPENNGENTYFHMEFSINKLE